MKELGSFISSDTNSSWQGLVFKISANLTLGLYLHYPTTSVIQNKMKMFMLINKRALNEEQLGCVCFRWRLVKQ